MTSATEDILIIRGGWSNVPSHLFCKTDLKKKGLRPGSPHEAIVWNSYDWIKLYDVNKARPPRKLTDKQKIALENGRNKLKKLLTCANCGELETHKKYMVDGSCSYCAHQKEYEESLKHRYEYLKDMFESWASEDFVILDTETTGLGPDDQIIEIAIIDKHGNSVFNSLVKPTIPIPPESTAIHGLSDNELKDAPSWEEVWTEINEILSSHLVLIFNDAFDCRMIEQTCATYNIGSTEYKFRTQCVMEAYCEHIGTTTWISLENASGCITSHRALSDCRAVLSVVKDIFNEYDIH